MYERWGYRIVDRVDWEGTNYVSVVLSKPLTPAPLPGSRTRPGEGGLSIDC